MFVPRDCLFFCAERLRNFFVRRACVTFFVLRGWVIFCAKRLCAFYCAERLRDFFVPRGCMIFFVPSVCMNFFVPRGCMILFYAEWLLDFFNKAYFHLLGPLGPVGYRVALALFMYMPSQNMHFWRLWIYLMYLIILIILIILNFCVMFLCGEDS